MLSFRYYFEMKGRDQERLPVGLVARVDFALAHFEGRLVMLENAGFDEPFVPQALSLICA